MEFRTQISLPQESHNQIDYNSRLLLLGSCFTENIGKKLAYFKFRHMVNPFGILFQPKAIENCILNAINKKVYTEKDLFLYNERWHCFEAHSALSDTSKEVLIEKLNTAIQRTHSEICNATHVIITLGTAWAYRFIESDSFVANCHKVPQKKFLKELLTVHDVYESLDAICSLIRSVNTKATILFTISPVRHLKDGFIENTQSKAHLISAVHQIINEDQAFYFPSYEIVMDELRDYRFYRDDMIHPNETAINYIWQRFSRVWLSELSQDSMKSIDTIQKGLLHKPFNSNAKQHQTFLKNLEDKILVVQKEHPFIKF